MIRFNHVSKVYPNGVQALKDVSFHIPKGQLVFLTGHSGAGKSSALSLIIAEHRPTEGDVRVSGYQIAKLTAKDVPRLRRRSGSSASSGSSSTRRAWRGWRAWSRSPG